MNNPKKKVTIEDIAKFTGVSRGTVSRAFNQRSDINKKTRRMVLEAAQKLNYLPNPSARGLAKGKSECIGIVVPNLLNPFLAEMVTRMETLIRAQGMSAILGIIDHDIELQESVLMRMASGQVDGLLITPCECPGSIKQLNWINKRIPVVALKHFDGLECDSVMCNDELAVKMMIEHLYGLGHRRIAFVSPDNPEWSVSMRRKAYENTIDGLPSGYIKHITCDYNDQRSDESRLDQVVEQIVHCKKSEGLTAVLAYDDIIAMLLMKKLLKAGYNIPKDLSIAGIDNIAFSQFGMVSLTSVAGDTVRLCELAIETLINRLKSGDSDDLRNVILKPRLYLRESTVECPKVSCSGAVVV